MEEAEWIGLPLQEAKEKLKIIEAKKFKPNPLKIKFTKELLEELATAIEEEKEETVEQPTER